MTKDKLGNIKNPRVRIAPSPTGSLHIGTVRTALFNYLIAKKYDGRFILRIENTDQERSDKKWERDVIEGLKWLGIEWDEGPVLDKNEYKGAYGPYRQSERKEIYKKYIKKLVEEDKAYFCFCTPEELQAQREYFISIGEPPRYSGKCRNLPKKTVQKYLKEGRKYVIRFKTPSKKVKFFDLVRGNIEFDATLIGDFVIAKDFEHPLYNFACVVDDFEMKITHVIRGEDHISNTPKQILLQEALGFPHPQYGHLPLILGPDRKKLSKRHGATSLSEFREEGYLPEAIINFIAFLGWNPGTEKEIYSLSSLIKEFSIERIQKGGAIFNKKRLDFLNGFYIRQKPIEKLTKLCIPYWEKEEFIEKVNNKKKDDPPDEELVLFKEKFKIKETGEIVDFSWLKRIVSIYQERIRNLLEITELTDFFFKNELEFPRDLLIWRDMTLEEIKSSLEKIEKVINKIGKEEFSKENIERILIAEAEKVGDRGKILWPLRVALTGKKASAGPFEIAEILGKEKTLTRIKKAIEKIKK